MPRHWGGGGKHSCNTLITSNRLGLTTDSWSCGNFIWPTAKQPLKSPTLMLFNLHFLSDNWYPFGGRYMDWKSDAPPFGDSISPFLLKIIKLKSLSSKPLIYFLIKKHWLNSVIWWMIRFNIDCKSNYFCSTGGVMGMPVKIDNFTSKQKRSKSWTPHDCRKNRILGNCWQSCNWQPRVTNWLRCSSFSIYEKA